MSKKLATGAIANILDALGVQRQGTLLALSAESLATTTDDKTAQQPGSTSSSYSSNSSGAPWSNSHSGELPPSAKLAESVCSELVQVAVLNAISMQKAQAPGQPVAPQHEIGSALEGRRLRGLALEGARLTSSFNRSDMSHSSFLSSYVAFSTFNLSKLNGACLARAQFHSCTFMAAEAVDVNAQGCRFSHCVFRQADLRRWDVRGATFFGCTFTLSDLSEWVFDSQTMVMEPVDWSRCRRIGWAAAPGSLVRECRVTGVAGAAHAKSLPPARPVSW